MKNALFLSTRSKLRAVGSFSSSLAPSMSKILIAQPSPGPSSASVPRWPDEFEKRISTPWRPGGPVDAPRVGLGDVVEDLQLGLHDAVGLRVRAAEGSPGAFDLRR